MFYVFTTPSTDNKEVVLVVPAASTPLTKGAGVATILLQGLGPVQCSNLTLHDTIHEALGKVQALENELVAADKLSKVGMPARQAPQRAARVADIGRLLHWSPPDNLSDKGIA